MTNITALPKKQKPPAPPTGDIEAITMARKLSADLGIPVLSENVPAVVAALNRYYTAGQSDALRHAQALVLSEREACAKMAEAFHYHGYDFTGSLELHEAIRARSQQ